MSNTIAIPIHSGFKGFIAGVSVLSIFLISLSCQLPVAIIDDSCSQVADADYKQRAYFELWIDGEVQASATFEGHGKLVQMKNVFNEKESWSFGPVNKEGYISVRITHFEGSIEIDSRMVGPLSVS
jgi:hypothetical protein